MAKAKKIETVLVLAGDIGARGVKVTDDAKAAAEERSAAIRLALAHCDSRDHKDVVTFGDAYKAGAIAEWVARPRFDKEGKAYDMAAVVRLLSGKTDKKDAAQETRDAVKTGRSVARNNWKRDLDRAMPEWIAVKEEAGEAGEATEGEAGEATVPAILTPEQFLNMIRPIVRAMDRDAALKFLADLADEKKKVAHLVVNSNPIPDRLVA